MSRLNPRRRWLAKQEATQKAILLTVKQEKSQLCEAERLQHGDVKSCVSKFTSSLALKAPREFWEGTGKRGSVVAGKFKPKSHAKPRFGNS